MMEAGVAIEVAVARAAEADVISRLNRHVQAVHAAAMPERFKAPGPETFPAAEVLALMAQDGMRVLLAKVDGAPAGYVLAEMVWRAETSTTHAFAMVYVHHISVDPAFRRQGVGAALIAAARAEGARNGIVDLGLDVWSFNDAAQRFFTGQGLRPFNVRLWTR